MVVARIAILIGIALASATVSLAQSPQPGSLGLIGGMDGGYLHGGYLVSEYSTNEYPTNEQLGGEYEYLSSDYPANSYLNAVPGAGFFQPADVHGRPVRTAVHAQALSAVPTIRDTGWQLPADVPATSSVMEPVFEELLGSPSVVPEAQVPLDLVLPYHPEVNQELTYFRRLINKLMWSRCSPCLVGIGRERVTFAPFHVQTTQPGNQLTLAVNIVNGFRSPNRSEFLWAAAPRGPSAPETGVDYQEFRIRSELAPNSKFSIATDIPIRAIDPNVNPNHAGLSDMTLTTKTVLLTGTTWQLTQVLNTFLNTGGPSLGLGTGHTSMEPGILARYKWSDRSYLHAEMKYLVPIAGTPGFAGELFTTGFAWSWVGYDTDDLAIVHSVETVYRSFQNGASGGPPPAPVVRVDGDDVVNLFYGIRTIQDAGSDLGLLEYGFNFGFAASQDRMFRDQLGFDVRFSW